MSAARTGNLFIGDTMGGGVALFDFDDDGWLDIYFVNGCLALRPKIPPSAEQALSQPG